MELSKEWNDRAYKIMSQYQKEEGEQEYYMYYDIDVPKMIDNQLHHYANKVEQLLKNRQQELLSDKINATSQEEQAQYDLLIVELSILLKQLTQIKP